MFYCFVGNKGGGKSYGLLQLLIDELRLTERNIFTNLPLRLDKLQAWVDRQEWSRMKAVFPWQPGMGGKVVDVAMRIHKLEPEQLWEFWLYHAKGKIEKRQRIPCAGGYHDAPDFRERDGDGGNLYVIDEAHIPFPSDRWAAVAKEANFYNTQERKLLDDTIFATQVPDQLAKPLRQLMQEWTETRNMNKEPILGMRFPGRFRWRMTLRQPGGVEQTAINHRLVRMDKDLAGCYDTLTGVGITGRGDVTSERGSRGVRWQYAIAGGIGAICLLCALVWVGGKAGFTAIQKAVVGMVGIQVSDSGNVSSPLVKASGVIIPEVRTALSNMTEMNPPARVQPVTSPVFTPDSKPEVKNNSLIGGRATNRLSLIGTVISKNRVRVFLSDGRTLTQDDKELTYVGPRHVMYAGERIEYPVRSEMAMDRNVSVDLPEYNLNPQPQLSRRVVVGTSVLDNEK